MRSKILIVFLVLIILGLGGYIAYDKVINKETEEPVKEEKSESKEENLDITSKDVTSLFNNINTLSSTWTSEAYYCWLFKQDSLKVEDMSDELKVASALYLEYLSCSDNDFECVKGSSDTSVGNMILSASRVNNSIKKLYGDVKYKDTNVKSFACGADFTFDNASNNYTAVAPACGYAGSSFDTYDYRLVKAIKKDNSIDIYVKVAFEYFDFLIETDNDGNVTKDNMRYVYSDFGKKNQIYKTEETTFDFNNVLEEYGDKLPVYKLHFENEDGEYHFKSIEKQN